MVLWRYHVATDVFFVVAFPRVFYMFVTRGTTYAFRVWYVYFSFLIVTAMGLSGRRHVLVGGRASPVNYLAVYGVWDRGGLDVISVKDARRVAGLVR